MYVPDQRAAAESHCLNIVRRLLTTTASRCCQQENKFALGWRSALIALLSLLIIGVYALFETEFGFGLEGLAHKGQPSSTEHGSSAHLGEVSHAAASGTPHAPAANAWHPGVAAQRLISCYNENYATKLPYPTFDDFLKQDLPR